jgi:peptidoglycan hydrolase-like protein with peptidoglycan-binding domain
MNRTLTAGVALAATLGMAGLAMAQGYALNTNAAPNPGTTSTMPAPSTTTNPGMPGNQQGTLQNGQQTGSPVSVQQAQQQLRAQGLYNGAIDGRLGPEMKTALTQFQQRNGLPQTGTLDQQTSARLMQSSSNGLSPTPASGSTMLDSGTTRAPANSTLPNR